MDGDAVVLDGMTQTEPVFQQSLYADSVGEETNLKRYHLLLCDEDTGSWYRVNQS